MTRLILALILLLPSLAVAESPAMKRERIRYVNRLIEEMQLGELENTFKSICWVESLWRQYDDRRQCFVKNYDVGISQLNAETIRIHKWNTSKCFFNTRYNLEKGAEVLKEKIQWVSEIKKDQERYANLHRLYGVLGDDDLTLVLRAYNGFKVSRKYPEQVKRVMKSKPWRKYLRQIKDSKKNGFIYGRAKDAA